MSRHDPDPDDRIWSICETTDGGRTIRVWGSTAQEVRQLNAWLARQPDVETLASPEVIAEANELSERAIHVWGQP